MCHTITKVYIFIKEISKLCCRELRNTDSFSATPTLKPPLEHILKRRSIPPLGLWNRMWESPQLATVKGFWMYSSQKLIQNQTNNLQPWLAVLPYVTLGDVTEALVLRTHVHAKLCMPPGHTTPKNAACNSSAQMQEYCMYIMHALRCLNCVSTFPCPYWNMAD